MSEMMVLIKKLYPLALAPVSPDTDKAIGILKDELPFKIHEFRSLAEHNGWIVPMEWSVKKARIKRDGKVIYDGKSHPLGVIGYSESFKGELCLAELKKHLFYSQTRTDAIVYHCDQYYKSWRRDWGFCMPKNMIDSFKEDTYSVELETEFKKSTLKVADYFIKGQSSKTIILNAHNCHASQANDDISGVAVGIEVMRRLKKKSLRYSYRLIVAPEILGTVFYLSSLPERVTRDFTYGIFLEMLGSNTQITLQKSFTGESEIDKAALYYLTFYTPSFRVDNFRKIVGNDETVWEASGYEIPTVSLSRFPYPEYHTHFDAPDIIKEDRLEESVQVVMGILDILETNSKPKRKFKGLIALSNPRYGLYMRAYDPSIPFSVNETQKKWNYLMDCLPRYFDEKTTILDIAIKHELPYREVYDYIRKFKEKGLIEFQDA